MLINLIKPCLLFIHQMAQYLLHFNKMLTSCQCFPLTYAGVSKVVDGSWMMVIFVLLVTFRDLKCFPFVVSRCRLTLNILWDNKS